MAYACICHFFLVPLREFWNYMQAIGIAIGVLLAAMVLLSVGVIFRKDHSFRSQHIHENKRMKQDGIHCATAEDKLARRKQSRKMRVNEM